MNTKSLITAAAAALLIAGIAAVGLNGRSTSTADLTAGAFPGRLPHSIDLPDSKLGVELRVTELSPDRLFPKDASVDFKNGDTGREYHRDDGTIERIEVFYKSMPYMPMQLKWRATIGVDGVTYTSDSAFWSDGTRKRVGERLADGTYSIVTYFKDGTTENERTLLAANGSALYHRVTTENGLLLYIGEKTKDGIEEKTFAENGNPVKYVLRSIFRTKKVEYYGDTGKPKMDVTMESTKYTVIYFGPDGKPTQKRVIGFGGMDVFVYENGVPKYQQFWQRMNPYDAKKGAESVWQLYSVARIDANEKPYWKLWFYTDAKHVGQTVPNFSYESKDGLATEDSKLVEVNTYSEGGCLLVKVLQNAQFGDPIEKTQFPQDRGCSTLDLPLDLMKEIPDPAPITKVPDPEPHY